MVEKDYKDKENIPGEDALIFQTTCRYIYIYIYIYIMNHGSGS